jgi:hypothetical protein
VVVAVAQVMVTLELVAALVVEQVVMDLTLLPGVQGEDPGHQEVMALRIMLIMENSPRFLEPVVVAVVFFPVLAVLAEHRALTHPLTLVMAAVLAAAAVALTLAAELAELVEAQTQRVLPLGLPIQWYLLVVVDGVLLVATKTLFLILAEPVVTLLF